jgi:hypothetical protein
MRLTVGARGDVELVLPRRVTDAAADRFLAEQAPWLERQLAWEPVLGLDRPGVAWLGGDAVAAPHGVDLARWYRREARARITAAVEREAGAHDFRYARVAIRDTRSRWGSCSSRGTLSFSWRLVSSTSSATCASRTTRRASGRSSSRSGRTGASTPRGCGATGAS